MENLPQNESLGTSKTDEFYKMVKAELTLILQTLKN